MSEKPSKRSWWQAPQNWPSAISTWTRASYRWLKDYAANDTIKLAVIIWAACAFWLISLFIEVRSLPWFPYFELSLDGLVLIRPDSQAEDLRNLLWALSFIGGALAAVIALINALRRTRMMQREQDAEIFAKAVEQLGHESREVRLGAIYALEGLMRLDFGMPGRDGMMGRQIAETLAAYVRERSPLPDAEVDVSGGTEGDDVSKDTDQFDRTQRLAVDVEAAVTVLARSCSLGTRSRRRAPKRIDLSGARLDNVRIPTGSDCRNFFLFGTSMRGALVSQVNFEGAHLVGVNLSHAVLTNSDFRNAYMAEAKLDGSLIVIESDFSFADLSRAELRADRFVSAVMAGANLTNAKLIGASDDFADTFAKPILKAARWEVGRYPSPSLVWPLPHRGDGKPLEDNSIEDASWKERVGPQGVLNCAAP